MQISKQNHTYYFLKWESCFHRRVSHSSVEDKEGCKLIKCSKSHSQPFAGRGGYCRGTVIWFL